MTTVLNPFASRSETLEPLYTNSTVPIAEALSASEDLPTLLPSFDIFVAACFPYNLEQQDDMASDSFFSSQSN